MLDKIFRKLPMFKGKHALAKLLFNKSILNGRDVIVAGKYACTYKLPNIKENIGFDVFLNGVYEKSTIDFTIRKLPRNGVMIDIGANIGAIAFPVAMLRKDINTFCIEASPRVFNYLCYNKEKNNLNSCTLINMAVSDEDGRKENFFSPVEKFGKGSLSPVFTTESEAVETISLDKLIKDQKIKKVDFIKIDIEGYEYYAFKGAGELLQKPQSPDILFEFVDWAEESITEIKVGDAQRLLIKYGYNLFSLMENGNIVPLLYPLTKGQAMIFATKN